MVSFSSRGESRAPQIQAIIDRITQLFLSEVKLHPDEQCDAAFGRIVAELRVEGLISASIVDPDLTSPEGEDRWREAHGNTLLKNCMTNDRRIRAVIHGAFVYFRPESRQNKATDVPDLSKSRVSPQSHQGLPVFNEDFLVREFDRRQARGPVPGLIYSGFLINELLPGLGFSPVEARRILRQLEARGIVRTVKKTNPGNPDRPTTFVELNKEHPAVRKALDNGRREAAMKLPLGRSSGELGSQLLIRERR